jgi:anaerobic selenocysteine-containing dehydrogenase
VFIGADDLRQLGITPGQKVTLRSSVGEMRELEVHEFNLPAGNLMAYYPEANVLVSRATDPRSKTPAFKSVAVAVDWQGRKAKP